jgi:glutamate racemase
VGQPIGVFDSGLGGLTVVQAIRRRLPAESIVYFGDTARVPYGTKSGETVARFAAEDCEFLCRYEPKFIVVACNTASAAALPTLSRRFRLPILGVIEPGARAAESVCDGRPIGILGTERTIASGAYRRAIERRISGARLVEKACPLLVPLVEEGRGPHDPIVKAVLGEYLQPMIEAGAGSVVLGCTHYPLIKEGIADALGPEVHLVDSAEAVAEEVAYLLTTYGLLEPSGRGGMRLFVSDNPERFQAVGRRFLGEDIPPVTHVSPEDFFGARPDGHGSEEGP